jgi:hypothetical protein
MHVFPLRIAPILACLAVLTGAASQPAQFAVTAIINANVLPMDRPGVLRGYTVLVERGVIARLDVADRVTIPPGARRIDATGQYLIPGLADVHVHLASNRENEQRKLLQLFVANGVTTVVNLRGTPQMLELRRSIALGRVSGPTLFTTGPYVNEPFVRTPDDVERAVTGQKRDGYDFVKLHGDLSLEAYRRLNAVARREGIRVIGHAPRNLGLGPMFEERQYAVAHAEEFIYDTSNSSRNFAQIEPQLPTLAQTMARAGMWLMPNLTAFKLIGRQVENLEAVLERPEMRYLPESVQRAWEADTNPYTTRFPKDSAPGFAARYAFLQRITRAFHVGGVRLLVGTDAMNAGVVPGFSAHDEMADLVGAGLQPFDALQAATSNAAAFLAPASRAGVIAPGRSADLVLLDADPLEYIGNTRRITGVMLRGSWLARPDLDRLLKE